jgi:hypothetical protein
VFSFFRPASSSFGVRRRRSAIDLASQEEILLSFLPFFSHLRESWRAGIAATRDDVREEHCIVYSVGREAEEEGLIEKKRSDASVFVVTRISEFFSHFALLTFFPLF